MISAHNYVETIYTASTIKAFIKKATDLGRRYFTYTDIGGFYSVLLAYKAAQKANLDFIPGVVLYIKDESCPANQAMPEAGYFTISAYATDQTSFQALVKMVSQGRKTYTNINDDSIPLFTWKDLEGIANHNINLVLSGHHSLVAKGILADKNPSYINRIAEKLSAFEGRVRVALVAGKEDASYSEKIQLTVFNPKKNTHGTVFLSPRDKVDVLYTEPSKKARIISVPAMDLTKGKFTKLVAFTKNGVKFKSGVDVISAKLEGGFYPLSRDFVKEANKIHLDFARKYNLPIIASDNAFMADKLDKPVQDVKLVELRKPQAQYMMSDEEYRDSLLSQGFSINVIDEAFAGSDLWAEQFQYLDLKYDIRVPPVEGGQASVQKLMDAIKTKGRMKWGDSLYEERLAKEIKVLAKNKVQDLLPYFFPIMELQEQEMAAGVLVGPARGSAAGSLVNYLIGVTHVDPIKYDLSFERFLNEDRVESGDWPDIDGDRADRFYLAGNTEETGILYKKYGKKAAQISTRSLMRLKSSILDVNRYLKGEVEKEIEQLSKNLPAAPQGVSDHEFVFGYEDSDGNSHPGLIDYDTALQQYVKARPEEWAIVERCLGITRAYGKHASAFLIADKNIEDFIPMMPGEVFTQYEAKGAAAAGGIKYDFLVVANLLDLQKCMALINKKAGVDLPMGYFSHRGEQLFIWNLPEVPEVFDSVADGNVAGLFQFDTASMEPFVRDIKPKKITELSDIVALVRPGTMDAKDEQTGRSMAREYVERRFGRSHGHIPELNAMIPETYGVILFQEQSSRIAKELGGMSPVEAEKLRRALSKKLKTEVDKFKAQFVEGAKKKVSEQTAIEIWNQIEAGSRYSFNLSHSTSYAIITYATMFLRHFYPLEFWTAVLSNADKKEIKEKYYKHVRHLLAPPDINLSGDDMIIDYASNKIRSKLTVIKGLSGAGMAGLMAGRPYANIQDLVNKEGVKPAMARKLIVVGAMDSLFHPGMSLLDKLQAYEDAVEIKKHNDKRLAGKKVKDEIPRGKVDSDFLTLSPIDEFKLKKEILPTLEISLTEIIADISKKVKKGPTGRLIYEAGRKDFLLLSGELTEKVDNSEITDKWVEYCTAAYVLSAKEFSYSGGAKRALKLIVDTDGYNREVVLWPDYDTGQLIYPSFKEGDVVILQMKKRNGKDPNIQKIFIDFL